MSVEAGAAAEKSLLNIFYRHNLWANLNLFDTCLALTETQLGHTDRGTYGSIRATLTHLVRSEERYLFFLNRQATTDVEQSDTPPTITDLKQRVLRCGQTLIQIVGSIQPETPVQVGEGEKAELMPATIVLLQTLYHSNEHRTHVATMLGQLGIAPPPLSGWEYYDEEILGIKTTEAK